jgi:hypothetical protein
MPAQAPRQRLNELHLTALGPGRFGSLGYSRTIPQLATRLFRTQVGI